MKNKFVGGLVLTSSTALGAEYLVARAQRACLSFARVACAGTVLAAAALVGAPLAQAESLLVPAYIYPSGSGADAWTTLATTAQTVPTTVILNPSSGPGSVQDANYVAAIAQIHAAGGKVIGYVSTSYTNRALSAVVQDIGTYLSLYNVDGFFIDEMTSDSVTAHVQYYQSVYNYIKGLSTAYAVTGNPGTNVPELYASLPVADRFVVFENGASQYASYAPQAWQANYPTSRFAHIVYGATSSSRMQNIVQGAAALGAANVYVTSKGVDPYAALPKYWNLEVSAAAAN
ncbi:spherulation-specific family 4 protein [Ralstonia solanacearum]|uniref:spherulation-specific family 4 protein n=1 Tax=Ralstonia solanacearum TaxID=305 RepID=UPI001FFC5E23|nr:spherulation-specific family 4 protein [Ralstonia solanacearum]MDB0507977.1 spherulation-specific family 4 protein [Ralstonia solanacearum]MDB0512246.1 spherulation-specific family 4 protein [Ralstonia solanacearum]